MAASEFFRAHDFNISDVGNHRVIIVVLFPHVVGDLMGQGVVANNLDSDIGRDIPAGITDTAINCRSMLASVITVSNLRISTAIMTLLY